MPGKEIKYGAEAREKMGVPKCREARFQKGDIMETTYEPKKIEKILSRADEMLDQLNSGLIEDMEETRRIQVEVYAETLKKRRLEVLEKIEKAEKLENASTSEGIHEAIEDIVKAMKAMTSYLT